MRKQNSKNQTAPIKKSVKNKLKEHFNNISVVFESSLCRLFIGAILVIIAVFIKTDIIEHYLGIYASIAIGIGWILFAVFYIIMYIRALNK